MSIETGLQSYLTAYAGVSALVGTRVYPVRLPEAATLPAVTYTRITANRIRSHSGSSDLVEALFQFDTWGDTYGDARPLADQVIAALDNFTGMMGSTDVRAVFVTSDIDSYDPDAKVYRVIISATIWHRP